MQYRRSSFHRAERPGYALLLGLLITVVLGMILYYMRMYEPVYQIGKGKSDIEVPWRQWHKIQVRLRKWPLGPPKADQPQIAKALQVTAKPSEDGQTRSQLSLFFLPDGSVQGEWGGKFFVAKNYTDLTCFLVGSFYDNFIQAA